MTWAKLTDEWFTAPTTVQMSDRAFRLYVGGMTYIARHLTDGYIPNEAVATLIPTRGRSAADNELVALGVWERSTSGRLAVDFASFSMTRAVVVAKKESDAERQARFRSCSSGACAKETGHSHKAADCPLSRRDSQRPDPSRPDPKGRDRDRDTNRQPTPPTESSSVDGGQATTPATQDTTTTAAPITIADQYRNLFAMLSGRMVRAFRNMAHQRYRDEWNRERLTTLADRPVLVYPTSPDPETLTDDTIGVRVDGNKVLIVPLCLTKAETRTIGATEALQLRQRIKEEFESLRSAMSRNENDPYGYETFGGQQTRLEFFCRVDPLPILASYLRVRVQSPHTDAVLGDDIGEPNLAPLDHVVTGGDVFEGGPSGLLGEHEGGPDVFGDTADHDDPHGLDTVSIVDDPSDLRECPRCQGDVWPGEALIAGLCSACNYAKTRTDQTV